LQASLTSGYAASGAACSSNAANMIAFTSATPCYNRYICYNREIDKLSNATAKGIRRNPTTALLSMYRYKPRVYCLP
jgi:hypothetical protein